jgi:hypothetical protein
MPVSFIQTEKLYTINFFAAPGLAGWNSVLFLSLVLLLAWLGFYFYHLQRRQGRQSFKSAAWWLLFLIWLPIALSSWLTHYNLATQAAAEFRAPLADKWQARLCRIDNNQQFNGLLCDIEPTIKSVKAKVSLGASLCYIVDETASPFFNFALYDDFGSSADCRTADYVLVYRATDKIVYAADHHLWRFSQDNDGSETKIDLGSFSMPQVLGDGIFLLKRNR